MAKKRATKPTAVDVEPMVFEHVKTDTQKEYDRIADRIIAAVTEINAALQEAHDCAEMRVFLATSEKRPMQFGYAIYRLTHSVVTFVAAEKEWTSVKDPRFENAAGQGLDALRKKAADALQGFKHGANKVEKK